LRAEVDFYPYAEVPNIHEEAEAEAEDGNYC
jgi:hypothetical protein